MVLGAIEIYRLGVRPGVDPSRKVPGRPRRRTCYEDRVLTGENAWPTVLLRQALRPTPAAIAQWHPFPIEWKNHQQRG